jgi:putative DNA primase/helicase
VAVVTSFTATVDIVEAALDYASGGVRILPVNPHTKKPMIKDWPNAATTDPATIRAWWAKRPDALIGAATGAGSDFWAVDLDNKPEKNGIKAFAELEAKYGKVPKTWRTQTPSDGRHLLFDMPDGVAIRSRASDIAPGVDTRGGRADGSSTGFVILPPSRRADGKSYQPLDYSDAFWTIGRDLPAAPDWLLFLAIFSTRQRKQLGTIGIEGAEAFQGAPPREWQGLADAAYAKAWGGSNAETGQPLTAESADRVVKYIVAGINGALVELSAAGVGEREKHLNLSGLAIHSLLSGARVRGVDAQQLATIEADAKQRYLAVSDFPAFRLGEAITKDQVLAKWGHTKEDAEPRELWRIGGASELEQEVERLAGLHPLEYGRLRTETAKHFKLTVKILDDAVKAKRRELKTTEHGTFLQDPEPWPDPVDGEQLLAELVDTIKAHVVMPSLGAEAVALWVLFAHAHDAFEVSPILAISAPERECGKTSLMNVIGALVPKPMPTSNISTAAVFRAVEKYRPTVLIDEADTFLDEKAELQGVLNSGHVRQSAFTARLVGDDHDLKMFSTWAPKAIAKIRELPDTLRSRSVVIRLRRKLGREKVKRLPKGDNEELTTLRRKAFRWAQDNIEAIRHCKPDVPAGLENRAADNWEPLLAIADVIGWSDIAEAAALGLSGKANADDADATKSVALLSDIRVVFEEQDAEFFDEQDADRLSPTVLLRALQGLEESLWLDIGYGRPLTTHVLAKMLQPFGIKSRRSDDARYYLKAHFTEAWQRYLTPAATPDEP